MQIHSGVSDPMPQGYRLLFAAFAGLILAMSSIFQSAASAQVNKTTQDRAGAQRALLPKPEPTEPPYRPYPNSDAETCYNAQNHDAADLCAYWRAARAAERANQISYASVILSGLTLLALGITIWQTRGAIGEARRSNLIAQRSNARATRQALASAQQSRDATEAMREQNRIAEQSQRAWLDISAEITEWRFDNEYFFIHVKVTVKNIGQSPAHRVIIRPKLSDFAMESSIPSINNFYDERPEDEYEGHTILPGGEYNPILAISLPVAEWKVVFIGDQYPKIFSPRLMVNCTYQWFQYFGQTAGTYMVFARYTWQENGSPILVDCLDLIQSIELGQNQQPRVI